MGMALALVQIASAQDYRTQGGNAQRTGRATVQPSTVVAETVWNNAGRGFLRWWDPIFQTGNDLDNDEVGASTTLGTWTDPTVGGAGVQLASSFIQETLGVPPYRYAVTSVTGGNDGPDPSLGSTAVYQYQIGGLTGGEFYEIEVNLPIGTTNVNPGGAPDLRFTPHYQLYRITDGSGSYFRWVDMRLNAGGFASIGDGELFEASLLGTITVEVFNVCRRNDFGTLIDNTDIPGTDIIYADAVRAIGRSASGVGSYTASPVVGQLTQGRIDGQPVVFNQRVVSARNEDTFVGSLNKEVRFGVLSSFTHNGAVVNVAQPLRRNMVWSWPAVRPLDLTTTESDRYAVDRQNWIAGGVNPAFPRHLVFRQADNLSSTTNIGALFNNSTTFASVGPNHLLTPAVNAVTSFVDWEPVALPGQYFIEVHLPNNDLVTDLATTVTYQILQGGNVVATRTFNQSTANNWVRLPNQPDGFAHTVLNPLTVRILNTGSAQDVTDGRDVYADAIRFVGDADLGITATPAQVEATVDSGGAALRDVIVVARENGTVAAIEAHGNEATAANPQTIWTWPSENPATDPNNAVLEDGGVAETPTKFGSSAPLVANVAGNDFAYIGSDNGRVYCLEMLGRGDGTTRRRWSWPSDYDPSNPTNPMGGTNIGAVKGSVALASVGGTPAIIVAGSNGRIFALDASGTAASKSTTVLWQYPAAIDPPLGDISMTPVVANGQVTFACEDAGFAGRGQIHSIDENTGALIWQRNTRQDNVTPFGLFGSASPAVVGAPVLAAQTAFFVDAGGFITSIDLATGNVNWEEAGIGSGSTAPLSFAYMRAFDATGTTLVNAVPTILVASNAGTLFGFYADGTLNVNGNRRNWGFFVQSEKNQNAGFAVGGWPNAIGFFANRTHIYTGDGDGILYAFSSEDDVNGIAPITPGLPPGSQSANPADPNETELTSMLDSNDILVLTPAQYQDLESKAIAGTLNQADLTAITGAAMVQRRDFEFGETVYVAVTSIHSPSVASTAGYSIQYETTTGQSRTRPNTAVVRNVTGAPTAEEGGIALFKVPLLTTGQGGITPGVVNLQVYARQARVRGGVQTIISSPNTPAGGSFSLANPLAVSFPDFGSPATSNTAGLTLNPADVQVEGNLPVGYTGAFNTPFNNWVNGFTQPVSATARPGTWMSTSVGGNDPVGHGGSSVGLMRVFDRSLTALIQRTPLTNVKVQANDLAWQPVSSGTAPTNAAQAGVLSPIGYAGFEDLPLSYPNNSLDYPDLNRGGLNMAKSLGGNTENPLQFGVTLAGPTYTTADLNTYNTTVAGYEAGLVRSLNATPFSMRLNIPRYQPATLTAANRPSGYVSENLVYVDRSNSQTGFDSADAGRQFNLAVNVAPDHRISSSTKTIDLGSIPGGGGYYNGATGQAALPFLGTTFAPFNPTFLNNNAPQFQQFVVLNEGNVNLQNVRVARRFSQQTGLFTQLERPLELYSQAGHDLAWIDGASALYSDLDPNISPTFRAGLDPQGNVFLQKPRPGDPAPSRMSTNPRRRQNSNLNVTSGSLIADTTTFPVGDPFVGVAVPYGTPVGSYVREIFAFEDSLAGSADLGANFPTLGFHIGFNGQFVPEAFVDPGITLKFNVRETRLTNRPTAKTQGVFDNVLVGDAGFDWSSRQPTIARMAQGPLMLAFSSNRLDAAGPAGNPRARFRADSANGDIWRIHFASMIPAAAAVPSSSPITDLHLFDPGTGRVMETAGILPIGNEWTFWFSLETGDTLMNPADPRSARFHSPSLPAAGFIDPLEPAGTRIGFADRFMAFIGETTKIDRSGSRVNLSQVMIADLNFTNGAVTRNASGGFGGVYPVLGDQTSKKGKPAIVQNGNNVTLVYPATASGRTELFVNSFTAGPGTFSGPRSLGLGATFEEVTGVTANMRSVPTNTMDVFFTGQVRGRQNSEGFYGQIPVQAGGALAADATWTIFEDRLERLEYDPTTGMYSTPGVHWAMGADDVDAFELLLLNPVTGNFEPLIDNNPANPAHMRSRIVNRDAREMVFVSPRGGKVYVDARRGTVRLSGAVLGRQSQVFARYSPRFVRVSGVSTSMRLGSGLIATGNTSSGLNYRGATAVFDDRLLGIFVDAAQPWRNLTEDKNFWCTTGGLAVADAAPITHDRFYVSFNRTSNDGGSSARPVMSSLRFGLNLGMPIAVNPTTGLPISLTVAGASSQFVQVDPINARLYVPAVCANDTLNITYTGVDSNGQLVANVQAVNLRVGLIAESGEQVVPIEQVGQEGDFTMSLDQFPPNNPSLFARRPPLLWMVWSSTRAGSQDLFMQTMAPKTAPRAVRP
jgi:hypothetical protein